MEKPDVFENIVKPINNFNTFKYCFYLGERNRKVFMYKYMDIETAILCLKHNNIRFVEPTQWADKYESRFYTADYGLLKLPSKIVPQLYACCFTFSNASEAAWKTYAYEKTGLASRCVQFRINKRNFRTTLDTYAQKNNCKVYEGNINYSLSDRQINRLHIAETKGFEAITKSGFKLDNYLSLLLIKRQAFYYENEYRFFIVPANNKVNIQIFPSIPWAEVIDGVRVDNRCSEIEIEVLTHYLQKYNLEITPEKFDLYSNPDNKIIIGTPKPVKSWLKPKIRCMNLCGKC